MRPNPNPPIRFSLNKGGRPATRKGYIQTQLFLQPQLHHALRQVAKRENRQLQDCLREAVALWLDRMMAHPPDLPKPVVPPAPEVSSGYPTPDTTNPPETTEVTVPQAVYGTQEVDDGAERNETEEVIGGGGFRGLPFTL